MHRTLPCLALFASLALPASAQRFPWAAHWRLDESSGTRAFDTSPFLNHGTLKNFTGKPWVKAKYGNGLQFDGVDDHVDIDLKGGLPVYDGKGAPYTIAFWVKAPAQNDKRCYAEGNKTFPNGQGPLFTIGSGRTSNQTQDRLQIYIRNDRQQVIINWQSNTTVFDDKWHHVAWVDVAGKARLYVDGVQDTRSWDYTNVARSPQKAAFGKFTMDEAALGAILRQTYCCLLRGVLDDVRVYRHALTQADVKVVMTGGPHPACRPSVASFGHGCGAGTPPALTATGSVKLGSTLTLQITGGRASASAVLLFGGPLEPFDLGAVKLPGCVLYPPLATVAPVALGKLDATGSSRLVRIPVQNNPTLVCGRFTFQGATAGGAPLTIDTTGAVVAQVGQ